MEQKPIRIKVDRVTSRLAYTCGVIFNSILGRKFELVTEGEFDLEYAAEKSDHDRPFIPCNGLLLETGIRPDFPFPQPLLELPPLHAFDHLAWAFFHLSLYADHYQNPPASYISQQKDPDAPEIWVEDVAFHIAEALRLDPPAPAFDYQVTIDVDHPWKHRLKPLIIMAGGLLKEVLKWDKKMLRERWQAVAKKNDPFDIDDLIAEMCPAEKTTFFFLVDGSHPRDSRYSIVQPSYARRVQKLHRAGFGIALHPSYESRDTPDLFARQKELLEKAIGGPVRQSRQHYLRFHVPQTFQDLQKIGIQDEYSLCHPQKCGARTRIARPYPWFDLTANQQTNLTLVPAQVMDRTLQQYLHLDPESAWEKTKEMIDRVKRVNGEFVVILHNETFSESGEWVGWRSFIARMLAELKRHAG